MRFIYIQEADEQVLFQEQNLVLFCFVFFFLPFFQVANAADRGASAVLIYPDEADYNYVADTVLYGHVSL